MDTQISTNHMATLVFVLPMLDRITLPYYSFDSDKRFKYGGP